MCVGDLIAPASCWLVLVSSSCFLVAPQTSLAQHVPKLAHLHLRYCKRITDTGINTITNGMQDLYSLDLSFCTRISNASILNLLEIRSGTLSELRIRNCTQLDISMTDQSTNGRDGNGSAGRVILGVLQSNPSENCLCILDVRACGGYANAVESYAEDDPFVQGMKSLHFEQAVPGFFSRPARWNDKVLQRLTRSLPQSA